MQRIQRVIVIAAALALATFAGAAWFYPWLEPARLLHHVHGIDVSHHQGRIDWPAVKQAGVAFAFIKATEGGDFVDPRFVENWQAAKVAGVRRGAYHFFTQCRTGQVQAANFARVVPREETALAPVVDAEHMGPCKQSAQVEDVVAELADFLDRIDAHFGKRPIIYTTREFHDTYLRDSFKKEAFWLRSLVLPPRFRDGWLVWQYHNRGRRAGIEGPVDLNVIRAGRSAELLQ